MIHWLLLLGFVLLLLAVIIVRSCVEHPPPERKDNVHLTDRPRLNREELLQMRRDKLPRNLGETQKEE